MAERAVYAAQIFKTEDRVITHIWAMSRAFGAWPGYKRVPGGYVCSFEADPLPLPPPDDGEPVSQDDGEDELGVSADYGWRDDDGNGDGEPDQQDEQDGTWHDDSAWPGAFVSVPEVA